MDRHQGGLARHRRLVRDLHSGIHLDLFLVSGVASVLLIRFYLRVTGYPQVGGATLHIAHMLWGGLLMLAALVLLLAFLGRATRWWAALLGGIGFGTFIDELGKFITRDNDYFYRPTVALIYVVFVLAYVATRSIRSRRTSSPEEYLVNALQELEEAALHDLQREERERALQYLRRAGSEGPLAAGLTRLVHDLEEAPARPPGRMERAAADILHAYRRLARRPVFWRAVVIFFILQVGVKLLHVGTLIVAPDGGWYAARLAFMSPRLDEYALPEWLQLGSSLLSGALVAAGIVALRRSRQTALRLFQRSILVSVFVTQVFMFYRSQWEALVVLAFNLLLLAALGYMRAHEEPEPA